MIEGMDQRLRTVLSDEFVSNRRKGSRDGSFALLAFSLSWLQQRFELLLFHLFDFVQ